MNQPSKTRKTLSITLLAAGLLSLIWTIVVHTRLFGIKALPTKESTVAIILATLLVMVLASLLLGSKLAGKLTRLFLNTLDLQLALLTPVLIFLGIFVLGGNDIKNDLAAFFHRSTIPFCLYILLILLVWISTIFMTMSRNKPTTKNEGTANLTTSLPQVKRTLWMVFIFLAILNFLGSFMVTIFDANTISHDLSLLTKAEMEASIYTYASSFLHLAIALGFFLLSWAESGKSLRWIWTLLGLLFLAFSIDEVIQVHEGLIATLRFTGERVSSSLLAYLAPLAILLAVILYLIIRTFRANKVKNWMLFFLGFVILMTGAVFIEGITESMESFFGEGLVPLLILDPLIFLEEGLEMVGILLILTFVLDQVSARIGELRLKLTPKRPV